MEKFKYGPLIWNCFTEDDESGNYYWNGSPPVGYDDDGIPIDSDGLQCLPIDSPVHPSWRGGKDKLEYNEFLGFEIPSIKTTKSWFDDNFLIISEDQCKKYIIKWIRKNQYGTPGFWDMVKDTTSLKEMMDKVWPQEEHK